MLSGSPLNYNYLSVLGHSLNAIFICGGSDGTKNQFQNRSSLL